MKYAHRYSTQTLMNMATFNYTAIAMAELSLFKDSRLINLNDNTCT